MRWRYPRVHTPDTRYAPLRRLCCLSAIVLLAATPEAEASKRNGKRRNKNERQLKMRAADKGNAYGPMWDWHGPVPLHTIDCAGRACRPGEGNLKGYGHWKMPFADMPIPEGLTKHAPGWSNKHPDFPIARYESLVVAAKRVQRQGLVVLSAADFDYRVLALNWYRAASRAGVTNALVHALDRDAYEYLLARQVATNDGAACLNAWNTTKLLRHIQRALAERHMAAAALVASGLDVLLMDTTAVLAKDPSPFLLGVAPQSADIMVQRASCNPVKEPAVGCGVAWNLLFLRGSRIDRASQLSTRELTLRYVRHALEKGLIDFYLRWWMGHHCIEGGYTKLFKESGPRLEGGVTPQASAAGMDEPNVLVSLRKFPGLRIGLLPRNLFPYAGSYPDNKATALVGRILRPDKDPTRSHRLRLDRYDERDHDELREAMQQAGLWLLPPSESMLPDKPA